MSDDEGRKRAEALEVELRYWGEGAEARVESILAAFAKEREEERERCAGIADRMAQEFRDSRGKRHADKDYNGEYLDHVGLKAASNLAARIRSAGPAEGEVRSMASPPQGAPTASAPREPRYEAALMRIASINDTDPDWQEECDPDTPAAIARAALANKPAAAPSAQPRAGVWPAYLEADEWRAVCDSLMFALAQSGWAEDVHELALAKAKAWRDQAIASGAPPPTPQASETPPETLAQRIARITQARAEANADAMATAMGEPQASETPGEGEVWSMLERWESATNHATTHLSASGQIVKEAARALLARRPHGR